MQARAYAEREVRAEGADCLACANCQWNWRTAEVIRRAFENGPGGEWLGGKKTCLRVLEEQAAAAKAAAG